MSEWQQGDVEFFGGDPLDNRDYSQQADSFAWQERLCPNCGADLEEAAQVEFVGDEEELVLAVSLWCPRCPYESEPRYEE